MSYSYLNEEERKIRDLLDDRFANNLSTDEAREETVRLVAEKFTPEQLTSYFKSLVGLSHCGVDDFESYEKYLDECIFKLRDWYWEGHPANQDWD